MKNHFIKTVIICALMGLGLNTYSQSAVQEARYKYGDKALGKLLLLQFHEQSKPYNLNLCVISAIFAKFTIDTIGNIKDLTFSEPPGSARVFKEILGAVIRSTNGLWIPRKVNGKAVESLPFILPLVYDLEAFCNQQKVVPEKDRLPRKEIPNRLFEALSGLVEFENNIGKDGNQTYCILLDPLITSSIN